jgi:thiol-disulfide isomerase/thioredoxin
MTFGANWFNRVFGVFVACALISITCFSPAMGAGTQVSGAAVSEAGNAPDFEIPDLAGSTVSLSKFKGDKPVLIYFWATWCPYCIAVRPAVLKLRGEIPKGDLEVLAINVGGGDSMAKVKKYEEAHPSPLTVLYDGEGKVAKSFHVQGIPHFVLIDKKGVVKYSGHELPEKPLETLKK